MSGATCAHTPNSHQSDWQEHDTIPRRAHQPRRCVSEDRRKMLVPSALIAAASPGKLRLAKYCSYGLECLCQERGGFYAGRSKSATLEALDLLLQSRKSAVIRPQTHWHSLHSQFRKANGVGDERSNHCWRGDCRNRKQPLS